jgi:FKBP-type peptidyl-prolyl cis-trans isomerase
MSKRFSLFLFLLLSFSLFAADAPQAPADLTAPPADAEKSDDGLVTKVLTPGSGKEKPAKNDFVRVRYTVWKADGTLVQHLGTGQTLFIDVPKMIPGWGLAAQKMVVGEKRRAWVPPSLTGGKSDIGLVFDTELVEIVKRPTTPDDVAAVPDGAEKSVSGLAWKVLTPGREDRRPTRGSTVVVHYTGWTTDGKMFDSSVLRGLPAEFPVTGVIKGWTEGLQLMQIGEKRRFWIPARLAYGDTPTGGRPAGMLVFDVELLNIK